MYRQILFIAVAALLPSALSENVVFKIDKTLNDGINLDSDHVTEVQVMYGCTVNETGVQILQISVTRGRKIGREEVKLYFANEEKNILELTVTTKGFSGVLYDTPHSGSSTDLGEFSGEVGNDFQQIGAQSILRVHTTWASWFPSKTNKVSGSLQSGASAIYNYYGIKNYPISLPDTMVVENFANLPCKQS